jgi:hypothetical protein
MCSRLGLVSTDSRALAVWGDTRAGTRASSKQDLGRAVVAFSDPPQISGALKWLLLIGGIAVLLAGVGLLVVGFLWRGAGRRSPGGGGWLARGSGARRDGQRLVGAAARTPTP